MTKAEYYTYCKKRDAIISQNKSNRIKGIPQLPVPAKIKDPEPHNIWTPQRFSEYFRTGK